MKFALTLILTLSTFSAHSTILKLSFEEHFTPQKVVMDQTLILELMRPDPGFDLDVVMLAMKKETPQKKSWSEGLRGKLQGFGTTTRL